jgi:GNAT superfamily N-acetyltransferase
VSGRLAALLAEAAENRFPPADGTIEVVLAPDGRADAVVAFTGYNVVASRLDEAEVRALLPPGDPFAAPMLAPFLHRLGERLGAAPGVLDAVLAAPPARHGSGGGLRLERVEGSGHARVVRSLRYREDVCVYAAPGGLLTIGRGLAGRLEVSVEVAPEARTRGLGRALAAAALRLAPPDEAVFAQVSPGNAASLRTFLAAGYRPIGSEVLFLRA